MLSVMDLGGDVDNLGGARLLHTKTKRLSHTISFPLSFSILCSLDSQHRIANMRPISVYSLDLGYESDDALLPSKEYVPHKSRHAFVKHPLALHSIILGIYTVLFFLALMVLFTGPDHGPNLIYSPARSAISFQRRVFDSSIDLESPFMGNPRPELDDAWHRLLRNTNIRVSGETLRKVNATSIAFADGDGYYAQLGMYHELHCLKRIRHFIHKDYYNPNQSEDARRRDARHTGESACSRLDKIWEMRLMADQIIVWRHYGKV